METGTLEEVRLVAEQVSLSLTSTQATVIILSISSLNFVLSQSLLCFFLAACSHTLNVLMCADEKEPLSDLEDEPGNQKGHFSMMKLFSS